jgi:HEAT repeat protein
MITEEQIAQALRASRTVTLPAISPHGPLGLEQLAEVVAQLTNVAAAPRERVRRSIALPLETWERLDALARAATPTNAPPLTASTLAAVLLEQAVAPK